MVERYRIEDCGYETPCWRFNGALYYNGYGAIRIGGRTRLAHRWAYEQIIGPIPLGLTIDHLCRVRDCINPHHMEPVTLAENLRRGVGWAGLNATKTHCSRGHRLSHENTYHSPSQRGRVCRRCHSSYQRATYWGMRGDDRLEYVAAVARGDEIARRARAKRPGQRRKG